MYILSDWAERSTNIISGSGGLSPPWSGLDLLGQSDSGCADPAVRQCIFIEPERRASAISWPPTHTPSLMDQTKSSDWIQPLRFRNSILSFGSWDTFESSNGSTTSTTLTVPGPGAISGKAILALGKATLRGTEYLIVRRRLQIVTSKFPCKDADNIPGIEGLYNDVLELSRFVLCIFLAILLKAICQTRYIF